MGEGTEQRKLRTEAWSPPLSTLSTLLLVLFLWFRRSFRSFSPSRSLFLVPFLLFQSSAIFTGGNLRILVALSLSLSLSLSFLLVNRRSSTVSTRLPVRNQTTNTVGNADPDNSTNDRFWHRFERGREHRYLWYVISPAKLFEQPASDAEKEREPVDNRMSVLSRLCPASSIAGIGFLIECRAGFSILYRKIHLSVRCFSPLPVAGFLIKSQDITVNYFCFLRDTVVRECIWTLVAISYGYEKTLCVLAFESDVKLYRC